MKLDTAIRRTLKSSEDKTLYEQKKSTDIRMVTKELLEYEREIDNAILRPDQFCSIVVNGANQSAFGLAHSVTKTKDEQEGALNVQSIGILDHHECSKLQLSSMTEEHETEANHIVEF